MPTFVASARHFLCGWPRSKEGAAIFAALAFVGAQQPALATTRNPAQLSWQSAQATPSPQPNAAAPAPQSNVAAPAPQPNAAAPAPQPNAATTAPQPKAAAPAPQNEEKTSVPATVVDGEQLESVLGIEALSSAGDDMGRIVDIIVDRSGQVRAAIIDFGGFLGVGSRKIVVDWRSLHFDPKKAGSVFVNLTKDQLRVAPVYKAAEPVVMIGGPDAKPQ
jgi:PRC-barrel domain